MGRKSRVPLFAVDCGSLEARLRSVATPNFLERMMAAPPPEDRLDSWKEIAAYLKRDVTTVQRWEKREAMPVHRHVHDKLGSIYAFRSELDDWARHRHADAERGLEEQAPPPPPVPSAPAPTDRVVCNPHHSQGDCIAQVSERGEAPHIGRHARIVARGPAASPDRRASARRTMDAGRWTMDDGR